MKVLWIHWRASNIKSFESSWWERIKDLKERQIDIIVPQFDNSEDPTYESWEKDLKKINFDEIDVILSTSHWWWVITKYIIDNDIKVKKIIMIAPWWWPHKRENTQKLYKELSSRDINLSNLVKEIYVLSSKDDNTIPYKTSKSFAKKIWARFIAFEWLWHQFIWEWIKIANDFVEFWENK